MAGLLVEPRYGWPQVDSLVLDAVRQGAQVAIGGARAAASEDQQGQQTRGQLGGGHFYQPTVLTGKRGPVNVPAFLRKPGHTLPHCMCPGVEVVDPANNQSHALVCTGKARADDQHQQKHCWLASSQPQQDPTRTHTGPAMSAGVTPAMRVFQEELFGPVTPITAFSTEQEALALANSTPYGLAAYVYTKVWHASRASGCHHA
jgi:acyl-CoA reductase-like NAD-dependent aldehyde dehydrogenase